VSALQGVASRVHGSKQRRQLDVAEDARRAVHRVPGHLDAGNLNLKEFIKIISHLAEVAPVVRFGRFAPAPSPKPQNSVGSST
jgi:hypothetical protein